MSSWSKRIWPGARYAPPVGPPTVSEDDYHYMGPEDIVEPPRVYRANDGYGHSKPQHSPDILVLKHRGTTYPLHLPAFSIAEGDLRVGELRRMAAKETKTEDSRRVKLLYKGKTLKDDARACRDEGLKQNSELMCVISEQGSHEDVGSSDSADSEEMLENGLGGPRVEVDGTIRGGAESSRPKREGRRRTRRRKNPNSTTNSPRDSGFLGAPDSSVPTRSASPMPRGVSPAQSPPSATSTATTTQTQAPPPYPTSSSTFRPKTPMETLDAISHTFHTTFMPKCVAFTTQPPSDGKTRDSEYKKLSETILQQIILKLDAVETVGDEGLRAKRKQLVKETQEILSGLDRVWKGSR